MTVDQEQSMTSHLDELRKRIVWSLLIVVVLFAVAFPLVRPLVRFLQADLKELGIGSVSYTHLRAHET